MPKNSKCFRKIGVALAVSALTGSVIGTTWAATNVAGRGNGVALGEGAADTSNDENTSIAIGKDSKSKYDGSIAIGDGSEAVGNDSIVIGKGAATNAGPGIAIGSGALAQNGGNLAIGVGAKSGGEKSIVIGENTSAESGKSIVLGYNTHTSGYTTNAIAMGENIKLDGNYSDLISIGSESNAQGIGSIAIGGHSTIAAPVTGAVALGYGAATTAEGCVALGRNSVANRSAGSYGYIPQSGDKIGYTGRIGGILPDREAVFTAQKPANVDDSVYKSTDGAVSVGRESYVGQNGNVVPVSTRQITNVAAGGQDTDAVNVRQLKDLSAAVGTQLATKLDANAFQYVSINSSVAGNKDNKGATGGNSVAIGPNASATAVSNVAIGENSVAAGTGFATALGSGAKAENTGAVAIGSSANTTGSTGIAMGYEAKATGTNAVALGMRSQATSFGIAIGQAKALSQSAIALGDAATIDNSSHYSIGIGDGVSVTKTKQAVVAGVHAKADNSQQVVLLGSQAKATNSGNSVVIGTGASSNSVETVAIGKGTIVTDKAASSLAIGNSAYIGEMTPVDPGTKPSDTSNPGYRNIGTSEEVMTNPLDKSKYYFSTAVGTDAKAFGYQNTAFGAGAEAHNTNSLALGFIAVAKGDFSAAIGRNTKTDGTYATAVGFDADAIGESTLALGSRARANKVAGVALGTDSITNVDKGSFGYDPSGKQADLSAFLGDQKSVYDTLQTDIATAQGEVDTARQAVIDLQNSKNGKTAEEIAEIDKNLASAETTLDEKKAALTAKVTEANKMVSTWQATAAGVSIGDSETGLTRQINNVAAGTLDTDAVNVAQLKNVTLNVTGDNLTTDTTAVGNVNLATQQLAINGDGNITTTVDKDGQAVKLALSKDVTDKLGL
ncbi:hypothetical protein [uncultured Veillonella sp.]|uniref:hypothetical protein n=1 Tax=uncultured Veillonella sp. TaxID=159268 RepID=UPI002624A929|nr:hypothetical protein [uncultured Veillonella sp.]